MIYLLAAQALSTLSYQIPQKTVPYHLNIVLDGFIPVLVHRDAKIDLDVGLVVKGVPAEVAGQLKASTDVSSLKISWDGSPLPFDKDTVAKYFPETVTLSPLGVVIKNDMPKAVDLPVHLPGVDVKQFPDITFLAVEFPADGVEQGKSWTFTRDFSGSTADYTVTPTLVSADKVDMDITFSQDYSDEEGDDYEPVKDPRDATYDVKTHVTGSGSVEFDRKAGLISRVHMNSDAQGDVTTVEDKTHSTRDLKTTIDVQLQD